MQPSTGLYLNVFPCVLHDLIPLGVSMDIRGCCTKLSDAFTFLLSYTCGLVWEKWSDHKSRFSLDHQKQAPGVLYVTCGTVSWFLCIAVLSECSSAVTVTCVGLFTVSPAVGCLPMLVGPICGIKFQFDSSDSNGIVCIKNHRKGGRCRDLVML